MKMLQINSVEKRSYKCAAKSAVLIFNKLLKIYQKIKKNRLLIFMDFFSMRKVVDAVNVQCGIQF